MLPAAMHEHISDELIDMEVAGKEEMETTDVIEVRHSCLCQGQHADEAQKIDDDKIAGYRWYSKHSFLLNLLQNYEKKTLNAYKVSVFRLFLVFYVIFPQF